MLDQEDMDEYSMDTEDEYGDGDNTFLSSDSEGSEDKVRRKRRNSDDSMEDRETYYDEENAVDNEDDEDYQLDDEIKYSDDNMRSDIENDTPSDVEKYKFLSSEDDENQAEESTDENSDPDYGLEDKYAPGTEPPEVGD